MTITPAAHDGIELIQCSGSILQHSDHIFNALKRHGFVYLRGDIGIDFDKIDEVFNVSRRFFDQPLDKKLTQRGRPTEYESGDSSGFIPSSAEKAITAEAENKPAETREAFIVCPIDGDKMKYPNVSGGREAIEYLMSASRAVVMDLLRVLARGMGMPEEHFVESHQGRLGVNPSMARFMNYYPIADDPNAPGEGVPRLNEHTDGGSFTVLYQDDVGGLEVFDELTSQWLHAPHIERSVIVNTGNMVEIWTNGLLKAANHRVLSPALNSPRRYKNRYSVVYFGGPDDHYTVAPVNGDPVKPAYAPVRFHDYLNARWKNTDANKTA